MLFEQISKDYITAMKARDQEKSQTLNFLRAQLKNVVIEKRVEKLDDVDVVAVVKKQVKQRKDSIAQFKDAGRDDLVKKEESELAILQVYLPVEMSEEAIAAIVKTVIKQLGASSMKDMGAVMKEVALQTQGKADNKLVSEVVKKELASL